MRKGAWETAWFWALLFWGSTVLDGLSTWAAVAPHGGTLDFEVNPFLTGASWTRFVLFLAAFHGLIQLWFIWAWPRRGLVDAVLPEGADLVGVSRVMLWRFLTIHIPDRVQVVYTGITMYQAVVVAHLGAVVNNSLVAVGRPGGFDLLAGLVSRVVPAMDPVDAHGWSVALFYGLAAAGGVLLAHLWLAWRAGAGGEEAGFLEGAVAAVPEGLWRWGGVLLFAGLVVQKVGVRERYANQVLWGLETGIFAVIALSYALRRPLRSSARGVGEILVPVLGGVWPFLLLGTPRGDFGLAHQGGILTVMCLGTGLALWAYVTLRHAFTILVEARELVSCGPYRWIRHPIYAGQLVTALAVVVWRFSALNVVLFLVFALIQVYRARAEERKLEGAFPAYGEYRRRTCFLVPGLL